jgi:hypothetical protein
MWLPLLALLKSSSAIAEIDNPAIAYDYQIGSPILKPFPGAVVESAIAYGYEVGSGILKPVPEKPAGAAIAYGYEVGSGIIRAYPGKTVEPAIATGYQIGVKVPKPVPPKTVGNAIATGYQIVADVPGDTYIALDPQLDPSFVYSTILKRSPGSKVKVESSAIANSPVIFTADTNGDVAISLSNSSNLALNSIHPISFKSGKGALLYSNSLTIKRDPEFTLAPLAGKFNQEIAFEVTSKTGKAITLSFAQNLGLGASYTISPYKKAEGIYSYLLPQFTITLAATTAVNITVAEVNSATAPQVFVFQNKLEGSNTNIGTFAIQLVSTQFDTYYPFTIKNQQPIIPKIEVDIALKAPSGALYKTIRSRVGNDGYFEMSEYLPLPWHAQASNPSVEITAIASSFPVPAAVTANTSVIAIQSLYKNTPGFGLNPFTSITLTGYKENGTGAAIASGTAYLGLDSLIFTVTGGTYGEQGSIHLMGFDDPIYFKIQNINFVRSSSLTQEIEIPRLNFKFGSGSLKVLLESQSTASLYSSELTTATPVNLRNAASIYLDKEVLTQEVSNTVTLDFGFQLITSNKSITVLGATTSSGNTADYSFVTTTNALPTNTPATITSIVGASSDRPRTYIKEIELVDSTTRLETVTDPNYLLLNCPTPQILRLYSRSVNTVVHLITVPASLSLTGTVVTLNRYPVEPYYCIEFEIAPTPWLNATSVQISVKVGTAAAVQYTLQTAVYVKQLSLTSVAPGLPGQNLLLKGKANQSYSLDIPFLNFTQSITANGSGDMTQLIPAIAVPQGTYQGTIQDTATLRSYPLSFNVSDALPVIIQNSSGATVTGDFLLANSTYNYSFSVSDRNCAIINGSGLTSQSLTTISGTVISGTFITGAEGEITLKSLDSFGNSYRKSYLLTPNNTGVTFGISYGYISVTVSNETVGSPWLIVLTADDANTSRYYFSGTLASASETISLPLTNLPAAIYAIAYISAKYYKTTKSAIATQNLEPLYPGSPEQLKTKFHAVITGLKYDLLNGERNRYYQNGELEIDQFAAAFRSNYYNFLYSLVSGAKVTNQGGATKPVVLSNNFAIQVATDGSYKAVFKRTSEKANLVTSNFTSVERICCGYDGNTQLLQLDCFLTYVKISGSGIFLQNTALLTVADVEIYLTIKYFTNVKTVKIPTSLVNLFLTDDKAAANREYNGAVFTLCVEAIADRSKVSFYVNSSLAAEFTTQSVVNYPSPMVVSNKGDDKYTPNNSLKYLLIYKNALTAEEVQQQFLTTNLRPKFKSPYYPLYEELKILWTGSSRGGKAIAPESVQYGGTNISDYAWENGVYPVKTDSDGLNYLDCDGSSSLYLPNSSGNFAKLNAESGIFTSFFASVLRGADRSGVQTIFSITGAATVTLAFDQPTATLGALFATIGSTRYRITYPVAMENERMDIQLRPGATNATNLLFINGLRYFNNSTPFTSAANVSASQANQHQLGGRGLPAIERFKGRIYFAGISHAQPEGIVNEATNYSNPVTSNYANKPFLAVPISNGATGHYSAGLVMSQDGLHKIWAFAATNFGSTNVAAVNSVCTEYLL